mmetsp:Transcript_14938/g.56262  ORF Transcript_14938/g.56262 Transcript_14938/m.56262 type:complete len:252 (+) Transcript_14938:399-1154(+)
MLSARPMPSQSECVLNRCCCLGVRHRYSGTEPAPKPCAGAPPSRFGGPPTTKGPSTAACDARTPWSTHQSVGPEYAEHTCSYGPPGAVRMASSFGSTVSSESSPVFARSDHTGRHSSASVAWQHTSPATLHGADAPATGTKLRAPGSEPVGARSRCSRITRKQEATRSYIRVPFRSAPPCTLGSMSRSREDPYESTHRLKRIESPGRPTEKAYGDAAPAAVVSGDAPKAALAAGDMTRSQPEGLPSAAAGP